MIKIFLADDDAVFLRFLEMELHVLGNFEIQTFPTGEKCLENIHSQPDIIVLDYHLDGIDALAMNGLKTLDLIKAIDPTIPVIMLSSQDKIEVAINCMHHHAFDYVVKSETAFVRLHHSISNISKIKKMEKELSWYAEHM